jgi:transcriptional regulator with PAS, ATPase and Fis domain
MRALRKEVHVLKTQLDEKCEKDILVGNSPAIQEIYKMIGIITATSSDSSILIQGESGTGKELVAKAIHGNSHHAAGPFVPINCTAFPENLIESELFGHEKGAYTGAYERKIGRLELARSGTLFFDEIGDLSPTLQTKLLRLLQEREFERIGGNESFKIEARFIFATNRDLEKEVREGRFREDLFYRLDVMRVSVPPLRERREDIPLLVDHFLASFRASLGKPVRFVTDDALAKLVGYAWPGNVRELENVIERAVILADEGRITLRELPESVRGDTQAASPQVRAGNFSLAAARRRFETDWIRDALAAANGNRTHAARLLGISHRALLYKLKEYGLGRN